MPLRGLKVLDLSRVLAGPYCGQILGDLGADVIKVEAPGRGDDTRHWGEAYYSSSNRNKRSIALDLKNAKDLARVSVLAKKADILIENFKTDGLKKFGLDYNSLRETNPRLIYCSITGFGHDGPRAFEPGYDFLIQGLGGFMSVTGPDEKTPVKAGVAFVDICTGLYATISILAALHEREKSGKGQHCDLALLDTQLSIMSYLAMDYLMNNHIPKAIGNKHPNIAPYECFSTKDKPIILTIGNDQQFESFSRVLNENWHQDIRFTTNESRIQNQPELSRLIQNRLIERSCSEWMILFKDRGFPFGPVENLAEISQDPQVIFRDLFTKMDDGKTPNVRSPIRLSRTPIQHYKRPPRLNEHPDADFE